MAVLSYIFIYVPIIPVYVIPYMYLTKGGNLNHKMM